MTGPPTVRVAVLRSTGNYGHIRAELEAGVGDDTFSESLTMAYDALSDWLDLAADAEDLAQKIRLARVLLEDERRESQRAGALEDYASAEEKAQVLQAQDTEVVKAKLRLQELIKRREGVLEKMSKLAVKSAVED